VPVLTACSAFASIRSPDERTGKRFWNGGAGSDSTMIKAVDLRKGKTIVRDGELQVVHEATHVMKGKGASYMQTRIKNVRTGVIFDVRFRMDEKIEDAFVETKEYEYLYRDGANFVLMDPETYDQITISPDLVGEAEQLLKPNERVTCQLYQGKIVTFELPIVVELEVTDCPPQVKGATATNQPKEATLETGAKIRVPPFIGPGTKVRVDSRTGEYIERAK
jgi:elongation factor P